MTARAAVGPLGWCPGCQSFQPILSLITLELDPRGHQETVLACANPANCRQRAQLRGVWGTYEPARMP